MATQFTNADGTHLATRFGHKLGLTLQLECFESDFEDQKCFGDDGSLTTLSRLREEADRTQFLTAFTFRARAHEAQQLATRWSSHSQLAHALATEAQNLKRQALSATRRGTAQ